MILALTAALTSIAAVGTYTPFGTNSGASGTETFMFTGKPYDSATSLYYFGARFYDPTIGRFITRDSVMGSIADPMSLDRYAYARDNPLSYTDPTGQSTEARIDYQSIFFGFENWIRGLLNLPSCDTACQDRQLQFWRTTTPILGLVFPEGSFEGGSSFASARNSLNYWEGQLGQKYINAQTGDVNNADRTSISGVFRLPPGPTRCPDCFDRSLGEPPVISDVKVGRFTDFRKASDYANIVLRGEARPGTFYFLQSPYTGKIGPSPKVLRVLKEAGYDFVYFEGPWWRQISS